MLEFINKIVTIILIFVLLVLAPLLITYKVDDMVGKREILNDVNTFIDRVCDASVISQDDVDALYMQCNSHGLVVDVTVERMVYAMTVETTADGNLYTYDYVVDRSFGASSTVLNPKDMIKVTIEEKTYSAGRKLTYKLLKIDEGELKFSLCGMVG